jgi:hypothetical protein
MQTYNKIDAHRYDRERAVLFDATAAQNPFASSAWLTHFIEQVATDDWLFLVAEGTGEERAATMLYATHRKPNQFSSVSNYYASLSSAMFGAPNDRAGAAKNIIDQISRRRPPSSVIDFAPLDESSCDTQAIREALRNAGWYVKPYFCFGNWYLSTTGVSFTEYMSQRPSQLRNTWARKLRKFEAAGGRFEIADGNDETATDAIAAFTRVYSKSWKRPEPYPQFVPGWAEICAQNGWLRLGIAWLKDVPIAAQFWFTLLGKANIFKLAYDEDHAVWSAGTLLTARMIQNCIERDRVAEIDYLTGDDEYKRAWMSSRRVRIGLRACNPRTLHGLSLVAYESLGALKHRFSRVPIESNLR